MSHVVSKIEPFVIFLFNISDDKIFGDRGRCGRRCRDGNFLYVEVKPSILDTTNEPIGAKK